VKIKFSCNEEKKLPFKGNVYYLSIFKRNYVLAFKKNRNIDHKLFLNRNISDWKRHIAVREACSVSWYQRGPVETPETPQIITALWY